MSKAMTRSIRTDFIYNGQGYGDVADRLLENDMNPAVLRPWRSANGKSYITLGEGESARHFISNTPASLPYDAWKRIDRAVIEPVLAPLRVWTDLVGGGLTYDIPDGMSTTVLVEQTTTDFGAATISMDALKPSERDRPEFDTRNFPLPIIHGEFSFSARQLAAAGRGGHPLDVSSARAISRRIMEQVEALTLGTANSYSYGGGTIYGLTSHPSRLTKVLTLPTAPGWTPEVTYNEVLEMITDLQDKFYNGPYGVYFSPGWTKYMAQDYSATYPGATLMTKLQGLRDLGISWVRKLTYGLANYQIIVFQLTDDVIRALNGMDMTTVQWDSKGGLAKNFKIMCMYLPQLRQNALGQIGINHGVAA